MALWFVLKVNGKRIGTFEAQRRIAMDGDDTAVYDVQILVAHTGLTHLGMVHHRLDQTAWALVGQGMAMLTWPCVRCRHCGRMSHAPMRAPTVCLKCGARNSSCCGGTGYADYASVPCPDPKCPVRAT